MCSRAKSLYTCWELMSEYRKTIRQTDKHTIRQTYNQRNIQSDKHTIRQTDNQTNIQSDKQAIRQTDHQTNRQTKDAQSIKRYINVDDLMFTT